MKINPVYWFELPATDLDRAKDFYECVFGYEMKRQSNAGYEMLWFPSKENSPGATGAIMKGMGYKPSLDGATVYMSTDKMDEILEKIANKNGKIHVPKKDIGEYGYIAIFEDSEGNRVGLHQFK
jgi:predicted enzyme related to lactoylglutathione lyase